MTIANHVWVGRVFVSGVCTWSFQHLCSSPQLTQSPCIQQLSSTPALLLCVQLQLVSLLLNFMISGLQRLAMGNQYIPQGPSYAYADQCSLQRQAPVRWMCGGSMPGSHTSLNLAFRTVDPAVAGAIEVPSAIDVPVKLANRQGRQKRSDRISRWLQRWQQSR